MSAAWLLVAASIPSTCALAQTRPVTPGWQELTVNKEGSGVAVQSRIDTDMISLKLSGGQVEVRRTDIPIFAVDKVNLSLDHMALTDALRGKGADAALAAYRDFVTADLVKRGWKEATAERAKFSAGGKASAIYWAAQAEGSSGGKSAKLTLCLVAAVAGSSIVAMSGLAEDAQSVPAIKRLLTDSLSRRRRAPRSAARRWGACARRRSASSTGWRAASG
jgi:hypothetical protein